MQDTVTTDSVIQAAKRDVAVYGGPLSQMVVAEYINESNIPDFRVFQLARLESRKELTRFVGWCVNNNRVARFIPFVVYDATQ